MAKYQKGRDWAFVIYPESVNPNYLDILTDTHLQIAISPLHDRDIDPTGEIKKPHWHVLVRYDGPTTFQAVEELSKSIGGTTPIKISSARGMYRYHLHLDNPEKYQYSDKDRILLGGFNTDNLDSLTETEIDNYENELIDYIEEYNITEYYLLIILLRAKNSSTLLKVAKKRTLMLNSFIKSRKFYLKESSDDEENS